MRPVRFVLTFLFIFFSFLTIVFGQDYLPKAPSGLRAKEDKYGFVSLVWNEVGGAQIAGYNIYYQSEVSPNGDGKYILENLLPIKGTRYDLKWSRPGIYRFIVRTLRESRPPIEGQSSEYVRVVMPKINRIFLETPIVTKGEGFVDVAKEVGIGAFPSLAESKIDGYRVYMSDNAVTFGLLTTETIGNLSSLVIKNLETGKKYFFILALMIIGTEGAKSGEMGIIAKPYSTLKIGGNK